jgi:rfaE bifunctional protein nucleotidyltransferase chain/domain
MSLLPTLPRPRLLVIGDLILDKYTFGNADRVSPEAPVIVLRVDGKEVRLGGAASVAMLLRGLEAEVTLAGVVGDDSEGRTLRSLLRDEKIDSRLVLVDPSRPTTAKERIMGRAANRHAHQIVRVDHETRDPIDAAIEEALIAGIIRELSLTREPQPSATSSAEAEVLSKNPGATTFAGGKEAFVADAASVGVSTQAASPTNCNRPNLAPASPSSTLDPPSSSASKPATPSRPSPSSTLHPRSSASTSPITAILIADYAKGVCTPTLLRRVINLARGCRIPIIVDPARIADYTRYAGATLLKPNRTEAELATGRQILTPDDALAAARDLCDRFKIDSVIVTLDQEGMALASPAFSREAQPSTPSPSSTLHPRSSASLHLPTTAREVYDITGAGDMVLAALGLCLASGMPLDQAAQLANIAAGLEVEKLGVAPITRAELCAALASHPAFSREAQPSALCPDASTIEASPNENQGAYAAPLAARARPSPSSILHPRSSTVTEPAAPLSAPSRPSPSSTLHPRSSSKITDAASLRPLVAAYQNAARRIILTNGCFDLLHVGHVTMLEQAAALGDILIVAINSDASVRALKGPDRPVICELDRARMLASLACVDHVLIFNEPTPHNLLEMLRPDVLAKGGTTPEIIGREVVEAYGGRIVRLGTIPGISTTALLTTFPPAFSREAQPSGEAASCRLPVQPIAPSQLPSVSETCFGPTSEFQPRSSLHPPGG